MASGAGSLGGDKRKCPIKLWLLPGQRGKGQPW